MIIDGTRYVFEGDESPETETKAFVEMDLKCRNKNCGNYDKVIQTSKVPLS